MVPKSSQNGTQNKHKSNPNRTRKAIPNGIRVVLVVVVVVVVVIMVVVIVVVVVAVIVGVIVVVAVS